MSASNVYNFFAEEDRKITASMFSRLRIAARKDLYRYNTIVDIIYIGTSHLRPWRVRISSMPANATNYSEKIYVYEDFCEFSQAQDVQHLLEDMRVEPKKGPGIATRTVVYSIVKIFLSFTIIYDVMNHLSAMINR